MNLKLSAQIQKNSDNEFLAWVDNEKFKGTIVQASDPTEAWKKLLTSIKVKIAFDYGISFDDIVDGKDLPEGKKDVNLVLS